MVNPGKPSISMGHLYHGCVSHNQRVDVFSGLIPLQLVTLLAKPVTGHLELWSFFVFCSQDLVNKIHSAPLCGSVIVDLPFRFKHGWGNPRICHGGFVEDLLEKSSKIIDLNGGFSMMFH